MANAIDKGTFKANNAGFKALAVGPEIAAAVEAIATKGLAIAQGFAEDFAVTHGYADSFVVRTEDTTLKTGFGSHAVVAGILENTSGHAAAVEWGNTNDSRDHHVLGRTLDALSNG